MSDDWEQAVGRFILALGSIEHTTISFFSVLPDCALPKSAPLIPLGLRIALIKEELSRHDAPEYRKALRAIERIESLVPDRHVVAHNGVVFDVYSDGVGFKISSNLVSARNRQKRLTLAQMQHLADSARDKCMELSSAWIELAKYLDPSLGHSD